MEVEDDMRGCFPMPKKSKIIYKAQTIALLIIGTYLISYSERADRKESDCCSFSTASNFLQIMQ